MSEEYLSLMDLFSGCGGVAFGLHQIGFKTILANELHPDPAESFRQNLIPDAPELMKVGPIQTMLSNKALDKFGFKQEDVTCIAGGPPCQGFSMAGKGEFDDIRNQLFTEYLRVVKRVKPKSVIFENVPGFANRYRMGLREKLVSALEKMGYNR